MHIDLKMPVSTAPERQLAGFGGTSPDGREIAVNSRWLSRNGKPWVPVMGEFHFSRFPHQHWAESLGKMRAGGVGIVATYLFWIHHEEQEGTFRWEGDRDVGAFVRECAAQGLDVVLRIGPWAHGECRNGGFPDWLLEKPFPSRGNDPHYLLLVQRFYEAIFAQVKGLMFKDGGPVIGIQLDNEFGHCGGLHGEEGYRHMRLLKGIAREAGFEVPLYTTTGWGGGIVVEGETLPVLGGYADAPWAQHIEPLPPGDMFAFRPVLPDTDIGTDLSGSAALAFTYDVKANPYLTAELGGGLQVTHHRRPIVDARDVEAMALVKLGCGANLLGYYMYHGGTNPEGECSTLQESRATGSANDLPEWSYDFQAPLGEYGQVNRSWKHLRLLHLFLADYGNRLAPMPHVLPEVNVRDAKDLDGLRVALRGRDGSGFLFLNRHQRGHRMTDLEGVQFSVADVKPDQHPHLFPQATLKDGRCHIWPFGMDLDGIRLESATAQPLCRLEGPDAVTHVFFAHEDTGAELHFAEGTVLDVAPGARETLRFAVAGTMTKPVEVLVLTRADAENAAKMRVKEHDVLLVTEGILVQETVNRISLTTFSTDNVVTIYPADANLVVELSLKMLQAPGVHDWFLELEPEGDAARLVLDGKVRGDWFYTGKPWRIGLRRYMDAQTGQDTQTVQGTQIVQDTLTIQTAAMAIRIEVDPLRRTDAVYLERQPLWQEGEACSLRSVQLRPQYRCELKWS